MLKLAYKYPTFSGNLLQILKRLGYSQIDVAHDGVEAVEMSGKKPYDLILMDLQMPLCDGLQSTAKYCLRRAQLKLEFEKGRELKSCRGFSSVVRWLEDQKANHEQ